MGDPTKVVMLETLLAVIERDNLLKNVQEVGKVLLDGLRAAEVKYIYFKKKIAIVVCESNDVEI